MEKTLVEVKDFWSGLLGELCLADLITRSDDTDLKQNVANNLFLFILFLIRN